MGDNRLYRCVIRLVQTDRAWYPIISGSAIEFAVGREALEKSKRVQIRLVKGRPSLRHALQVRASKFRQSGKAEASVGLSRLCVQE